MLYWLLHAVLLIALDALASGSPVLLNGLRAVNFLSTLAEDMVVGA
jgi:hypothetical protein